MQLAKYRRIKIHAAAGRAAVTRENHSDGSAAQSVEAD